MSNKAPAWFNDFKNEFDEFKKEMTDFKKEFNDFKKEMTDFKKEMTDFKMEVISRLDNLEQDVQAIKNCPTIKAELQQAN